MIALALTGVIAALGWLAWHRSHASRADIDRLLDLAVELHRHPVSPTTASAPPWASPLLSQTTGYQLRDAHQCPGSRPAWHLRLEREGRPASILITPKLSPADTFPKSALLATMKVGRVTVYSARRDTLEIAGLESAHRLAFVVSAESPEEARRLLAVLAPTLRATAEAAAF